MERSAKYNLRLVDEMVQEAYIVPFRSTTLDYLRTLVSFSNVTTLKTMTWMESRAHYYILFFDARPL